MYIYLYTCKYSYRFIYVYAYIHVWISREEWNDWTVMRPAWGKSVLDCWESQLMGHVVKRTGHVCGLKDLPVLSSQSFHAFMKKNNLFFLLNSFLFKSDTKNCRPIYAIVSFRDHIVAFLVQLSEDLELLQDGRVLLFLIRAFKHREIGWRSCLFWLLC